jgi:hypothetical protein
MLSAVLMGVYGYAECHYATYRYAECRGARHQATTCFS